MIDTGCGIPEEDLAKIFDRYYRSRFNAAASTRGAGLGLAISRRILELHGSEIEVQSRLDEGTTFSFSLALAPGHQPSAAADLRIAPASP